MRTIKEQLKFKIEEYSSKGDLLDRLKTIDPGIIYIYCHGGFTRDGKRGPVVPYLGLGKSEKLTPIDILAYLSGRQVLLCWKVSSPLVFINGCQTAELKPDVLVNFVDAFASLGSSGVIGTEVPVHQLLANEIGSEFLHLFESKTVGEAMRQVGNQLLCKGNLMGLAYSSYCLSSLHIAETRVPPRTDK